MFGFPDQPREDGFKHKKNLLRTVRFQFKYSETKTIRENHERLEILLRPHFPIKNDVTRVGAKIRFEPSKTPILESASGKVKVLNLRRKMEKKYSKSQEGHFPIPYLVGYIRVLRMH